MATADLYGFLSAAATTGGGGGILPSLRGAAEAHKGFWADTGDPTAFIAVLATTEANQEHLRSAQRAAFSRPDLEGPNNREGRTIYSVRPTFNPSDPSDRSFPPHPWGDMTRAFGHSFPPSLSLPYIQTGGIFWQTFNTGVTKRPACSRCSSTTPLFSKRAPTLIPKPAFLPPFFESRMVWAKGRGGNPHRA